MAQIIAKWNFEMLTLSSKSKRVSKRLEKERSDQKLRNDIPRETMRALRQCEHTIAKLSRRAARLNEWQLTLQVIHEQITMTEAKARARFRL